MILEIKKLDPDALGPLSEALSRNKVNHHFVPGHPLLVVANGTDDNILKPFDHLFARKIAIGTPYQLASSKWKKQTSFDVNGVTIGGGAFNLISGPCSVENEEQIFTIAAFLAEKGVKFIRGGAYKPRTSPYSFRGLGKQGLELIGKAAKQYGLRVVTELMDLSLLDEVHQYADIIQVGSRNMQNFHLLNELGKVRKPVLLKRGMHAKVNEWLLAAEYMLCGGNDQVILCERGIRSFDPETRNVMDIGIIPLIKELSHLPVIADPSHGTGAASRVIPLSLASAAAGADGLIVETHPDPVHALSDSQQAIDFSQFNELIVQLRQVLTALNRKADYDQVALKLQSL